ncbi:hypothetical protein DY000_02025251 [Brassica cretica]|uniref:Uncharacterized protein n=1 Tax=Brassica cretica TaxID=69181 RepID=A0ABQ7EEM5_BRACR|nr:hypothetical protein DY000_02025251 [Brassica cretica]
MSSIMVSSESTIGPRRRETCLLSSLRVLIGDWSIGAFPAALEFEGFEDPPEEWRCLPSSW